MKRKRYADEQIAFALRQAECGTAVEEICRKMGVFEPTFYRWRNPIGSLFAIVPDRLRHRQPGEAVTVVLDAEGVIVVRP